ncbi:hypothetical protein L1887_14604 [Cichorium endivia]|nr:hypothetical protein L1887_14604 [Cichorium endivia]
MAPLFSYTPSPNVKKAESTPLTTIVIHATNVSVVYEILMKVACQGLDTFVQFLNRHSLHYALSYFRHVMHGAALCEFSTILISLLNLRIPLYESFSPLPSKEQCKSILSNIGYC